MNTTDTNRLRHLERTFNANGGRGIDLADEIDHLRGDCDRTTCPHCPALEIHTAHRATIRQARAHFNAGGTVLVSDRGHEPTFTYGMPGTITHSLETTTWADLVAVVRNYPDPNQRYYIGE